MPARSFAALLPLALLGACGSGTEAPGGTSPGEAKALDEAAEMIEQQRLDPGAIPPSPASEAPGPPATGTAAN